MGPLDLLNHLANFAAPALWMAVMVSLLAMIFMKKVAGAPGISGADSYKFNSEFVGAGGGAVVVWS